MSRPGIPVLQGGEDVNALEPLTFGNDEFDLAFTPDGDGGWWIPAGPVAEALGFREPYDLLRHIPEAEKGSEIVRTLGGEQRVLCLTLPGFFRALGQRQAARIKDADTRAKVERFQAWNFGDVLPSIASTGAYIAPSAPQSAEVDLMDPEVFHKVLGKALAQRDTARAELAASEAKVAELEPAAEAWRSMRLKDRDLIPSRAVKLLQSAGCRIGTREIHAWLHENRWTFRRSTPSPWEPYAEIIDRGWMKVYADNGFHQTERGPEPNPPQACFTLLGLERARDLLIKQRGSTLVDPGQTRLQLVAGD